MSETRSLRHLPRDLVRRVRDAWHGRHGGRFIYHGVEINLPPEHDRFAGRMLLAGTYEAPEAELVIRHMPADRPVIEFGGSLGVVSALVRSRLAPDTRQVVVEANPDVLPTLKNNLRRQVGGARAEVVHAALAYDRETVTFTVSSNVHASSLDARRAGREVEVPVVTLADCLDRLGMQGATLIADVEGAEIDMAERDADALRCIDLALIEIHQDALDARGLDADWFVARMAEAGLELIERREATLAFKRRLEP